VGGVDYGHALEGEPTAAPGGVLASLDRAPRGRTFRPLPGTRAEVETIAPRFGARAVTLLGAGATEARLRDLAQGRRVLHLATHGFVREDLLRGLAQGKAATDWLGAREERRLAVGHDPMNLAGLALAGANPGEGGGEDDGILTALEASYLDLDGMDLVVLSACESSLGKAAAGEGVLGLVRGFRMAGAKRVVGSLWAVDDAATRELMTRFYERWAPGGGKPALDAAEALREAQAHLRSQARWSHPYYWAAWVLWGGAD
jgi:CHAT domain-containing protein